MRRSTISAGRTHTVQKQKTETYSRLNISGELNIGGQVNIGDEPQVRSHWLSDNLTPEWMARIVQTSVGHTIARISEIVGEIPPFFGESPAANLTNSRTIGKICLLNCNLSQHLSISKRLSCLVSFGSVLTYTVSSVDTGTSSVFEPSCSI